MTFKNMIGMCMLFIMVPLWIGIFWADLLNIKGKLERFLNAWILGLVTMLALGQFILVPMVAAGQTLTNAVSLWKLMLTIPALLSFFVVLRKFPQTALASRSRTGNGAAQGDTSKGAGFFKVFYGCIAAVLIFGQAFVLMHFQHIDDDDSRFVAEEVSAVVHDTMLVDDPITVDFMYWDVGEVRKDLTSPWTMYVAMCCRILNVHPAVFSHTLFPFFMIPICYVVYGMIGRVLFKNDMEKVFLFLIFLSVLQVWGYTSTHTVGSMLLLRIWQGKAVVAGFIVPFLLYLMYRILQQKRETGWIAALYAVSFAASLLSGIGIVLVPVMLALYGLVDFIFCRRWRKTAAIWLAAVPCGIYLGYYLMGIR